MVLNLIILLKSSKIRFVEQMTNVHCIFLFSFSSILKKKTKKQTSYVT